MKEQIYTIPVNEGFEAGGECAFCNMMAKLEQDAIEYTLGPSYMEDDIRMETDKIGFCPKHYNNLYHQKNRLGLGLITHTHFKRLTADMEKLTKDIKPVKKGIFSKADKSQTQDICDYIDSITKACFVCNKIDKSMDRYIDTFFFMWVKMPEIRDTVKNCKGFCIDHFSTLLRVGEKKLSEKDFKEFVSIVAPIQIENMKRVTDEIEWFTDKFDYRYKDEPWGNSKDAVPRGITKLASEFVE